MSGFALSGDFCASNSGFELLFDRLAGRFGRVESRRQARAYLAALLTPVKRKNGSQLAEAAGDLTPGRMQRLLNTARWDADVVRDDVWDYVAEGLGHHDGVLVVDETGFVKKGAGSAGVHRYYLREAGRARNCQVAVFLAYATPRGQALVDRELHLPRFWIDDCQRRARVGIPAGTGFVTRPEQAAAMLARARRAGPSAAWVSAGSVYGRDAEFREFLDRQRIDYVVAVPGSQEIHLGNRSMSAATLAARLPPAAWRRLPTVDAGADRPVGDRPDDWAVVPLPRYVGDLRCRWLLARRGIACTGEEAYHLCAGPAATSPDTLVRVAATSRATAECVRAASASAGLDHYQVRRYDAWYRHITLAMAAHAHLAVRAASGLRQTAWALN